MFYLVCTKSKLLDLIHNGWSDPRFHYNRMADDVTVYQDVDLSIQHSMDDLLIPAIYDDTKDVPARANFQKQVDINEANIAGSLAMQGLIMLQSGLVAAIDDAAIKPLTLVKPGEEWFGVGVEALNALHGEAQWHAYQEFLAILTDDEPGTPFRAASVDLMHPMDLKQLRGVHRLCGCRPPPLGDRDQQPDAAHRARCPAQAFWRR